MLGIGPPCTDIMVDNVSLVEPAIGAADKRLLLIACSHLPRQARDKQKET